VARHLAQLSVRDQRAHLHGCGWLVALLPQLAEAAVAPPLPHSGLAPERERWLMFAAVGRYLTNVAGPAGTLVLLDDLQWASADALALLATLLHAAPERPLRVVGAYRSTEVGPGDPLAELVADLARVEQVAPLTLGPLALREARELLSGLLEGTDASLDPVQDDHIEGLAQRTGGVPFFLVSCAQALRKGTEDAAESGAMAPKAPWNITQMIRQRVAALPESAKQALNAAAVIGRTIPGALLTQVVRQPEDAVLEGVEAACQARLLVEGDADIYQFAHDLIHEVIAGDLSARRRKLLHLRVAEVLEATPDHKRHPAELADHFMRAGELGRALPYALLAGDQTEAVYAYSGAETHYRAALELAHESGDAAHEAEALEKLGSVLKVLGRLDEAFAVLERSIQGHRAVGNRVGELRALAALIPIYAERGEPDEGAARAQAILITVEVQDIGKLASTLAAIYIGLAYLHFTCGRPQDQMTSAKRAVELAHAAGDDALLARALHRRNEAAWNLRLAEEAVDLQELIALAEGAGESWVVAYSLNHLAWGCLESGEIAQGRSYIARALDVAEQRHYPALLAQMWFGAGEFSYYLGEWPRARDEVARAAEIQHELDQFSASWGSAYPPLLLGMLDVAQGRFEEGKQRLERAIGLAAPIGDPQALAFAGKILAECDLLEGHAAEARARLMWLGERCRQAQPFDVYVLQPLVAWAELELGGLKEAAEALAPAVASASGLWRMDALRAQALLAIKEERWKDGEQALDQSLALCRALPYPYAEAKSLYVYGQLYEAKGEAERAREQYAAALAICARLGEGLYRPHIERALDGAKTR
jgi:tetratricopeptide (TPR) repeat protein